MNEKWMIASDGSYYAILPNGDLRKWLGSASASMQPAGLIATFNASYYTDPSLIWNAAAPTQLAGYVSVAGNQITLSPPSGYTGRYTVEVSVSDGIVTSKTTFSVTVT